MIAPLGHVSNCLHQEHLAQRKITQKIKVTHGSNSSLEGKNIHMSAIIVLLKGEKRTINDPKSQITQAILPAPQSSDRLRKLGDMWQAPPPYTTLSGKRLRYIQCEIFTIK